MKTIRITGLIAACLLAAPIWAQDSSQALNLKLPANVPAASASSAAPVAAETKANNGSTQSSSGAKANAATTATANTAQANGSKDPPGAYYGDTSGAMGDTQAAMSQHPVVTCDDATYNQPQVHGEVTTGVVAGNHMSGGYTGGVATVSQAFGSCEHPSGGMSISVGGTQGHYGR